MWGCGGVTPPGTISVGTGPNLAFLSANKHTCHLRLSEIRKFKNMETALQLRFKHFYNRERVSIVLFRGNNQILFIQMMKLRPWINLKFKPQ